MSRANRSAGRGDPLGRLKSQEAGLLVAILAVLALIYVVSPGPSAIFDPGASRSFFTSYNLQTLSHSTALYGVLAIGVTVVIIAGGIDLSIGSIVALSAVVAAKLMTSWLPGIGGASPGTAGLLAGSAIAIGLWTTRRVSKGRDLGIIRFGAVPAALTAAVMWLMDGPRDPGSIVAAVAVFAAMAGAVFALHRAAGPDAASGIAALVWGTAGSALAGASGTWSGPIATGSLVGLVVATGSLVGLAMGLRWGALTLAIACGGATIWGIAAGDSSPAEGVPTGCIAAAVTLALLTGMSIGVGHAFLINRFQLPPFIATLATLAGLRSLAKILSDNRAITVADDSFQALGSNYLITLPLFLALAALLSLVMGVTVLGRHLFALGGNEAAARLSGLPTRRLKTIAYAISGLLAALGGLLFFGYAGQANPGMGVTYELYAITAAVVGGCSLAGGVGSIRGTVLGLVLIQIVIKGTGLIVESIDPSQVEGLVLGVVVVLAVGFNQRFRMQR